MSYPPQEGYPPPATTPTAPQPTVSMPAQPPAPPAAMAYPPALAQISGTPYPAPEARRKPTVLVLAIASALLLVFGGLMLGLYINERGNLADTKSTLHDTRSELEAQKALVASQQEKLAADDKNTTDLTTQLGDMKTKMTSVTAERDVLVPCMRRIEDAFDAAANGDDKGVTNALRQARTTCDKAETKIDAS